MPTVADLSEPFGNIMIGPRPGADVCSDCFNLTDGYRRCYACAHGGHALDAMVPISYSIGGEQLHHALASYKRLAGVSARRFTLGLAAVLWRHLAGHERCLTEAIGVERFSVATTVPSGSLGPEADHPLHELAGLVGALEGRYERLLQRSKVPAAPHQFSAERYEPRRVLTGETVLLIDDTWTTGANAQSAAAALKAAGAAAVGAVIIGRYVNREWHQNDRHLRGLPQPYDWTRCALCAEPEGVAEDDAERPSHDVTGRGGLDTRSGRLDTPSGRLDTRSEALDTRSAALDTRSGAPPEQVCRRVSGPTRTGAPPPD